VVSCLILFALPRAVGHVLVADGPTDLAYGGAGVALFLAQALSGRPDLGHEVCSCCGAC
jgi:hypothetical protein